jgi:O-glycosyl hydrolase
VVRRGFYALRAWPGNPGNVCYAAAVRRAACFVSLLVVAGLLLAACSATFDHRAGSAAAIHLRYDPAIRYQTIAGWGGLVRNWHWDKPFVKGPSTSLPPEMRERILDDLALDLGLNRFYFAIHPDLIEPRNDNADPLLADAAGFDFTALEPYLREMVLPARERLRARGDRFQFYINMVMFLPPPGTARLHQDPAEYVEFALALLAYLRSRGLEVDGWVVLNEPDLNPLWSPEELARLAVRLGRALRNAGYPARLIYPETSRPGNAARWLGALAAQPGASRFLAEISYHSYDFDPTRGEAAPAASRILLAEWSRQLQIPAAQTEQSHWERADLVRWNGRDFRHALDVASNLAADMTTANASAWQLHSLVGFGALGDPWTGSSYLLVRDDLTGYARGEHYWGLRAFMRFVRPGAVRVALHGAGHLPAEVHTAAFADAHGRAVVVLVNPGAVRTVHLDGLPAGAYRISLSTAQVKGQESAAGAAGPGRPLAITLPAASIVTLWSPQ